MALVSALVRSTVAGVAGTALMGVFLHAERTLRGGQDGVGHPLDYDVSNAPLRAVRNVAHVSFTGHGEREVAKKALHWGYGGGAASLHAALAGAGVGEPTATLAFWAATTGGAMVMFPLLGATPPPWEWPRDMLVTSALAHGVYAVGAAYVDRRLRRR